MEILRACLVFKRKFPELRFLHLPTISKSLRDLQSLKSLESPALQTFFLSIMALYAVLGRDKVKLFTADQFATAARERMTILTPPSLVTVQTLLVLSMYEWGIGNRQQAWLSSGMAIRMM
jgi:hypothetical protein